MLDDVQLRNLVRWLEDTAIRYYPIEQRDWINTAENWHQNFEKVFFAICEAYNISTQMYSYFDIPSSNSIYHHCNAHYDILRI
jgi:hypothetical protein